MFDLLPKQISLMPLNSREQMRGYKIQGHQSVVIILWFCDTDVFSNLTGPELSDIESSSSSSFIMMMGMMLPVVRAHQIYF